MVSVAISADSLPPSMIQIDARMRPKQNHHDAKNQEIVHQQLRLAYPYQYN